MKTRWRMSMMSTHSRSQRGRRWLIGAAAIATVLGGAALWLPAKGPAVAAAAVVTGAEAALTVELIGPVQREIARRLPVSGGFAARDELVVGSDVPVRWTRVLVDVGSSVRQGQLLAQGDDSILSAQLAQYEAALAQAEARSELARANLQRAEQVQSVGVYSAETLHARRNEASAAVAQVAMVQAQIREVSARIAQTRVHAPADGVVSRRSVSLGAVAPAGGELFRIIRNGQVEWQAEVPEHDLKLLKEGTVALVDMGDGVHIEGRVRKVAPSVDSATRRGLAYVSLSPHAQVRSGGHAVGTLEVDRALVWVLPMRVVQYRDGSPYVYTLDATDVARARTVLLGARDGEFVEVLDLKPEERVVSTGAGFVKDGEKVHVAALPARGQP
jgi:HlyD family secretion protein